MGFLIPSKYLCIMLQLKKVNFFYGDHHILKDIDLTLDQGSNTAIIGESGCGKSTLLNLIYGLVQEDSGSIFYKNEQLLGSDHHLVPGHKMMKYVPQEYDLMPFTTVYENVGEYLSIQDDSRASQILKLLEVVDMMDFKDRKVKTLSGGQKQRVAIAKALVQQPDILLLDEPFSNIDNFRKNDLRRSIFKYLKQENISCLIATHDRNDVLSFTDETIIMRHGKIIDHRSTAAVYHQPLNHYGASLFNDVNVIKKGWFHNQNELLCYPEQLVISKNGLPITITNCFFKGSFYLIEATYENHILYFNHRTELESGSNYHIDLK